VLSGVLLGGCLGSNATPPATYDLVAPRVMTLTAPRPAKFQLVINEPSAVRSLETDRIMVKSGARVAYYKDAAWSDRLPRLMQARMVEAFQNAGLVRAVGSRADRLDADYELSTQVQAFQVNVNQGYAEAYANLYVKIIDGDNGRMVASVKLCPGSPSASFKTSSLYLDLTTRADAVSSPARSHGHGSDEISEFVT
jgi:cholesterol transport system auxiliary component